MCVVLAEMTFLFDFEPSVGSPPVIYEAPSESCPLRLVCADCQPFDAFNAKDDFWKRIQSLIPGTSLFSIFFFQVGVGG